MEMFVKLGNFAIGSIVWGDSPSCLLNFQLD